MMEDTDLLQRLSEYSTFFNEAHQDYNILISNVAEATNCEDETCFSVEKFEKLIVKVLSKFIRLTMSTHQDRCSAKQSNDR